MNITDTQRQIELEQEMREEGISRYNRNLLKKIQRGQESQTSYGQYLLAVTLEKLEQEIASYVDNCLKGRTGKNSTASKYLQLIEPEVVAVLSLRVALNKLTTNMTMVSVAGYIGGAIEDEIRTRSFEEQNPSLYRVVMKDLEARSSSYSYKRRKLNETQKRDGIIWQAWENRERILVGTAIIDLMLQHTGLLEEKYITKKNKRHRILKPSSVTMDVIKDLNAFKEVLKPEFYPCVAPPKPWTSPTDGGYHTHHIRPLPLVKTSNKNYLSELKHFDMPKVYGAINAMQETGYKVNTFILDTLKAIWDTGMEIPTLPPSENYPIPNKPLDIADNKVARTQWKREAVVVHTENNRLDSKRLLLRKTIQIADKFKNEPHLYMVYQLDFRGRVYAVPSYLTPQGTDFSKALLTFDYGKKITEEGACHLAIHGANMFGYDKCSLQARVDWVLENQEQIIQCANEPLNNLWWSKEADKPFQFLAFCKEWAGYIADPENFESCLPVCADGSCNGLQHFAAMLRSETTGKEVNLIPSDEPQDIYQRVADTVTKKLEKMDTPMADLWLEFGVTRGCTKRPCMVLPYGGRQYSFSDFIMDYVVEQREKGNQHPFGEEVFPACIFLAKVIWDSIGEVVHAATDAMTWLQTAARIVASEGLPITWYTPVGFPVTQEYFDTKLHQIETKLLGKVFRPTIYKETGKIDRKRQANGISPNFVHSIDSSHLMITIDVAKQIDIHSFSMVHDSYGTHAADAENLWWCLRKAFVEMYKQNDIMQNFNDDLLSILPKERHSELPPLPTKGSLDIDLVEDSSFFFA